MFSVHQPAQAGSESLYYGRKKPQYHDEFLSGLVYESIYISVYIDSRTFPPCYMYQRRMVRSTSKEGWSVLAMYVGGTAMAGKEGLSFTNILKSAQPNQSINKASCCLPVVHGASFFVALAPILGGCTANHGKNLGYLYRCQMW